MLQIRRAVDLWQFFRDATADGVQELVGHPITLRVVGKPAAIAEDVAGRLQLDPAPGYAPDDLPDALLGGILICVLGPRERLSPEEQERLRRLLRTGSRVLLVDGKAELAHLPGANLLISESPEPEIGRLIGVVLDLAGERALGLARRYPAFRDEAAQRLVQEAARQNARLAALSALPAVIPIVGNLVGAAADFLVLTRNQVELLYRLAAVHGRDLEDRQRLYLEIVPVVGSAFVWRTVARQLAALVPGMLGALPKVAIAYSGTFVVGQSAHFYYTFGRRPSKGVIETYYQRASEQVSRLGKVLNRG